MAIFNVPNYKDANGFGMPLNIRRGNPDPLDNSSVWTSYAAAWNYAKTDPVAYVGQILTVVENIVGENSVATTKVTAYKIENTEGDLVEVGKATLGDGKSIELDGTILSLKNFGKKYYKYATILDAVETVEGLSAEAADGTYCKVADTWYIKADGSWIVAVSYPADGSHYVLVDDGTFPAGLQPKTRLAEDGTIELAWYEPSSTTVEGLSEQMSSLSETVNTMQGTVSANAEAIKDKVDKVEGKQLSTEDFTTAEKSKLEGIAAGAQVNVIEKITVNGEEITVDNKAVDITVPTKISELTNDEEFIDNTVSNLVNYYTKTEAYTKTEVDNLIGAIHTMDIVKVDALPTENISAKTIYLVVKEDADTDDIYDEFIYTQGAWEKIGNTKLDLSNYLTKTGDASDVTVKFVTAESRELPASDEAINVIIGKVVKYLTDLKTVAFTGSYNDLSDTPTLHDTTRTVEALTAGETTKTVTVSGTILNAYVTVASTNEMVFCDVAIAENSVTVTLSEAYSSDLSIVVISRV